MSWSRDTAPDYPAIGRAGCSMQQPEDPNPIKAQRPDQRPHPTRDPTTRRTQAGGMARRPHGFHRALGTGGVQ
jgi:hypothetical protein